MAAAESSRPSPPCAPLAPTAVSVGPSTPLRTAPVPPWRARLSRPATARPSPPSHAEPFLSPESSIKGRARAASSATKPDAMPTAVCAQLTRQESVLTAPSALRLPPTRWFRPRHCTPSFKAAVRAPVVGVVAACHPVGLALLVRCQITSPHPPPTATQAVWCARPCSTARRAASVRLALSARPQQGQARPRRVTARCLLRLIWPPAPLATCPV